MNAVVVPSPWKQEIVGKYTTVVLPFEFDWKKPDYQMVLAYRAQKLADLRCTPELFPRLLRWYKDHQAQFIADWACTEDPGRLRRACPA